MKTVIFDIDDVCNNLVETTFRILNIPLEKIQLKKRFEIEEGNLLNQYDVERCLNLWKHKQVYLNCQYPNGLSELNRLLQYCDLRFHSYCASEEAAQAKLEYIQNGLAVSKERFKLEIECKTPPDAFIIVDDNLEYLMRCTNSDIKILVDKPWNKEENYGIELSDYNIIRAHSTSQAIQIAKGVILNGE